MTATQETPLEEITANVLSIADRTGDIRHEWDPDNPAEVELAREAFKKVKDKKYLIYRSRKDGSKAERIFDFDPKAERIVAMPQTVGG